MKTSARRIAEYPYAHLQLVCDSDYKRQYTNVGLNFTSLTDQDWIDFSLYDKDSARLIEESADYYRVRALWKNVSAQILKCDVRAVLPVGPIIEHTLKLVQGFLGFMRSAPDDSPANHVYCLDKSPGIPFSKLKIRSKKAVLEKHRDKLLKYVYDLRYPAVDSYNDKDELLPQEDLDRNKIRGVFGGSFHGVIRERIVYGQQNKAILENHKDNWIKYGLVKQYGGFNSAIQTLEPFSFIWESDCSGFDRRVCLKYVYRIRNALVIDVGPWKDMMESVTENNVHPLVLLPNGYVVRRQTGNDSGKNNTTVDNCIAHFIMMIYFFVKRLTDLNQPVKLSYIFKHANLLIYSDDKIGGTDLETWGFDSPQEFLDYEREVYAEFGMECKPSSQHYTIKKKGARLAPTHSFLGSYTHTDSQSGMYIPYPRFGKICSSVVRKYPCKDVVTRFHRIMDLTVNSYPSPEIFSRLLIFLQWFYNRFPKLQWQFDEILNDAEIDFSARDTFSRIYKGFEVSLPGSPPGVEL